MSYESVNRINSLKSGIENVTGESYSDLTQAVQSLKEGYGQSDLYDCLGGTVSGEIDLSQYTELRKGVLSEFTEVRKVILPDRLDEIPEYAFYNCISLKDIVMPNRLTRIRGFAFEGCKRLENISFSNILNEIGERAFFGCTSLANIVFPAGCRIGSHAFYGCTSLTELYFLRPLGLTGRAFGRCTSLTTVTINGKPSYPMEDVFYGCENLTTINVSWSEGEVANAPWGATNATINYNYTEG